MKDWRNKQAAEALAAMSGASAPADAEVSSSPKEQTADADALVDPSQLARVRHPSSSPLDRSINSKRMLIPILLTLGILMPAMATLKWLAPSDSPFAAWPIGAVAALAALGVAMLALAVMNMLHVRHLMQQRTATARRHAV